MIIQNLVKALILGILMQDLLMICAEKRTYFIKPSEDSSCTEQPCLTLDKYVANTAEHAEEITLVVSADEYTLSSKLTISNITKFLMISNNTNNSITCSQLAGFQFNNVSMVTLVNLTFIRCGGRSRLNAVLQLSHVNISIKGCLFAFSKGRVIDAANSTVRVKSCIFKNSSAGVLSANHNTTMYDIGSFYVQNFLAINTTAIFYINSSAVSFNNCSFTNNGDNTSNILHVRGGNLTFKQCEIVNSTAIQYVLISSKNSTTEIEQSIFQYNLTPRCLLFINESNLNTQNSIFNYNNRVLYINNSTAGSHKNLVLSRNTDIQYIVRIHRSNVNLEAFMVSNNMGPIDITDSKITFHALSQFLSNHCYFRGGMFITTASIIHFKGKTVFYKNKSWNTSRGGAIRATESRVYAHVDALFINNYVDANVGGALYLQQSHFICQKCCNFTGNRAPRGGAIYAINSIITIGNDWNKFNQKTNTNTSLSFIANSAGQGGAIYLEANSKLQAPRGKDCNYVLKFDNNTAQLGGAVYVNDYTSTITCKSITYGACFIQAPSFTSNPWNGWIQINSMSGNSTFYGGLLDRCKVQYRYKNLPQPNLTGIDFIKNVTHSKKIENMITSEPVRVCYCYNKKVDCNYTHPPINVKRGETFKATVAAVDQVNHTIDALIFIKSTKKYTYRLGTEQQVQKTYNGCSDLTLNIFSPNDSIELIMYAEGPCQDIGISRTTLRVNLENCTCPIGFQPQATQDNCSCDCDQQIKPLVNICYQLSQSLLRQGDFWINSLNYTDTIRYLIYPHCPYDYCIPSTYDVKINLNTINGVDAQCAWNRTGLLCSDCKSGLSLSLGSSHCLSCPKDWPKLFVTIMVGILVSGIVLIAVMLVLNLTVAVGTLNGLIFYANIVASSNITYSFLSKPNFFSVFIAWINLELGLDTCFYNGLDTYWKVWLQFAFPTYMIAIILIVLTVSKFSSRFAKLIGKGNPIATLTTLILLSYMKYLRNIIDVFSFAVLKYPDGSRKICWLPDANIEYLKGRHIPLFLMAAAIVVIGLPYTILLFTWQWLLKAPNYKLLRWIRNTRLNLFMEANVAAYSPKHRYWIGLLLLIRVALYLEIAYHNSYKINASILATGLLSACLLFAKTLYRNKVYKKRMIDYLDSFSYLNLLILSIAQLYNQQNKTGQIIAAKISVSATFLLLILVLTYHTIIALLEIPCLSRLNSSLAQRLQKELKPKELLPLNSQKTESMTQAMITCTTPTSTEIGLSDSKEASTAEYKEWERALPSFTTVDTNSLREPLLQEL